MSTIGAMNTGIVGIQKAVADTRQQAAKIASAQTMDNASPGAVTEPLINLKVAETQAAASAKVVETANETIGTLLDVTA